MDDIMAKVNKTVAIKRLDALCNTGRALCGNTSWDEFQYAEWKRNARITIQNVFEQSPEHLTEFDEVFMGMFPGNTVIQRALAVLRSMRIEVIEWTEEVEVIPSYSIKSPIEIFDAMKFDPNVVDASRSLFQSGHYSEAIFRAFTAVCNFVKEKSGLSLDGKSLMATVFSEEKPLIEINNLLDTSDHDEQEGFKFLFMGGQIGIRNPRAHNNIIQTDPFSTLEYLSLASLLLQKARDGKIAKS
jgi:uncharacterized protein (TIGR02391 family)